jgi:hypothetical protein
MLNFGTAQEFGVGKFVMSNRYARNDARRLRAAGGNGDSLRKRLRARGKRR